jgi:AraC-like DNA-binding protein
MERQRHDDNLLIYCVDGLGHASTDQWSGEVQAGDALLMPQGLAHRYSANRSNPWTIYWVHFQGSSTAVFNQYLGFREDDRPVFRAGLSPQITAQFRGLLQVQLTGYSTRACINAANQLRHLLTLLALEISKTRGTSQRSFDLEAVQDFMLDNLSQQLSLDTLASAASLSKYHFSYKYKALTGYSPIQHFLNMKMEQACRLLDSGDTSVKAVASALGYEDPLYFSRLFNKTVGLSPRAYRNSVKK